ncbi:arylsulfotransferase family protein [Frigoriglobus tundricola]|uniref:Arylsulfotransferase ASST n=1 Tax=Frigoriglobus tundricola TaxID=2774151 RepID=A0A6M5YMY6_9BACT|nr:arylsulfotransferase family protein [Frigoriglobus tundricola]QJW94934.1 hypothetical protein FTUN_2460 [Frigoriglobus tundricola]
MRLIRITRHFLVFIATRLKRFSRLRVPLRRPTPNGIFAAAAILGLLSVSYLFGAAVMYFRLPTSDFLDKAFWGARAWHDRGRSTLPALSSEATAVAKQKEGISIDRADKTADGFTLYTLTEGSRAALIDMRGAVVHRWDLPFRTAWPRVTHIEDPLPDEQIHWFRCHLYPNGDLLAVYQADGDTPYGYGLVKLNKDSQLLWAYAHNVHHDVDVGEDGTIYTLTQRIVSKPPAGLEFLDPPYLADALVVLAPDGRELQNIPIAEAFAHSPYALILTAGKNEPVRSERETDPIHANGVRVLNPTLAARFPLFKAGQVLLSARALDAVAVLDRDTRKVVWAARGVWKAQHDAEFLDNGHLLLYDNAGSSEQTRVLEYDPLTQAIPWAYMNERSTRFRALTRGTKQRLFNGNTLIDDPDNRRIFEVTKDKELVWEYFCPLPPVPQNQQPRSHAVTGARRYGANELTFLKGGARPRP